MQTLFLQYLNIYLLCQYLASFPFFSRNLKLIYFLFSVQIFLLLSFREIRCAKTFFRRRCPNFVFPSWQTEMYNLLKCKLNQNNFGKNNSSRPHFISITSHGLTNSDFLNSYIFTIHCRRSQIFQAITSVTSNYPNLKY